MIISNPLQKGSWGEAEAARVGKRWWVLAMTGLISVLAGGLVLSINWTVGDLAVFLGAILIFRGFFTMFSLPIDGSSQGWAVALGILEVGIGIALWVWPGPTLLVVAAFIGWWVMFSGIMTIAGAITGRGVNPYWGLMLAFGILEVGISFWLLGRPDITLVAALLAIGLWSIVYGIIQMVLAFDVKRAGERISTLAGGTGEPSTHARAA